MGSSLIAQDAQHRLQVLIVLADRERRFRHGRDALLDGFRALVATDIAPRADALPAGVLPFVRADFRCASPALRFLLMVRTLSCRARQANGTSS